MSDFREYPHEREHRLKREAGPELYEALELAQVAIDDWLHVYAYDLCDAADVAESRARIREYGTLSYIARVQETIRAALTKAKPASDEMVEF